MNESEMTRKLCEKLTRAGAFCVAIVGHGMQQSGLPDRYIAHRRWQGWFEAKHEWGDLTPLQKYNLKRLADRGANAVVVRYLNGIQVHTWDDQPVAAIDWSASGDQIIDLLIQASKAPQGWAT